MTLYRSLKPIVHVLTPLVVRVSVEGREHFPQRGPFLLISNHEGILDPILVQLHCPRDVHTLTKSTQFSGAFFRWLVPRFYGIPTRRYRIDPQAVRVILRRLEAGKGVGIYPEGERSWDGRLKSLRRGTIRVILKAGVPVIPCGIRGSYEAWPRWSHRLRRGRVRIRFGEPLLFRKHDTREARERALAGATKTIDAALRRLSGQEGTHESGGTHDLPEAPLPMPREPLAEPDS